MHEAFKTSFFATEVQCMLHKSGSLNKWMSDWVQEAVDDKEFIFMMNLHNTCQVILDA